MCTFIAGRRTPRQEPTDTPSGSAAVLGDQTAKRNGTTSNASSSPRPRTCAASRRQPKCAKLPLTNVQHMCRGKITSTRSRSRRQVNRRHDENEKRRQHLKPRQRTEPVIRRKTTDSPSFASMPVRMSSVRYLRPRSVGLYSRSEQRTGHSESGSPTTQ